jgi:hypothetical protein
MIVYFFSVFFSSLIVLLSSSSSSSSSFLFSFCFLYVSLLLDAPSTGKLELRLFGTSQEENAPLTTAWSGFTALAKFKFMNSALIFLKYRAGSSGLFFDKSMKQPYILLARCAFVHCCWLLAIGHRLLGHLGIF